MHHLSVGKRTAKGSVGLGGGRRGRVEQRALDAWVDAPRTEQHVLLEGLIARFSQLVLQELVWEGRPLHVLQVGMASPTQLIGEFGEVVRRGAEGVLLGGFDLVRVPTRMLEVAGPAHLGDREPVEGRRRHGRSEFLFLHPALKAMAVEVRGLFGAQCLRRSLRRARRLRRMLRRPCHQALSRAERRFLLAKPSRSVVLSQMRR